MSDFQPGQSVHYIPFDGCDPSQFENGVVKSVPDEEHAFVVYHCVGEWHRYQDFTAAKTHASQLRDGWHCGGRS